MIAETNMFKHKEEDRIPNNMGPILWKKGYDWWKQLDPVVLERPTLYMVQKWLREEKYVHIMIDVCASGYYAVLWKTNGTFIKTLADDGPNDGGVWNTYEEALEAGMYETLNIV